MLNGYDHEVLSWRMKQASGATWRREGEEESEERDEKEGKEAIKTSDRIRG